MTRLALIFLCGCSAPSYAPLQPRQGGLLSFALQLELRQALKDRDNLEARKRTHSKTIRQLTQSRTNDPGWWYNMSQQ